MAWTKLDKKYESQSATSKVQLVKKFNSSVLDDLDKDPDDWISELEVTRARLKKMSYVIEEKSLLIHVMNNLPEEYVNTVEILENRIDSEDDPLSIDELREKLSAKYDKLQVRKKYVDRELALYANNFKGRCRACGKFGHKAAECTEKTKTP